MSTETEKQQRRGIRFPTFPLSEALRIAQIVQSQGGGRLSTNATAGALDLSPTSSSFSTRVSAGKHFGLIDESKDVLMTTPLAKRILRPTSPDQEKISLSEAFRSFYVFKQLLERFHGTPLPERSTLENILAIEYGISDVSKALAYDVFVSSGKFAGEISETGKGLVSGSQTEIAQESLPYVRQGPMRLDDRLVELLMKIGSLSTALEVSSEFYGDGLKKLESMTKTLLDRTLTLARELEMPATRMSLKVTSDRLDGSGLEEASRFAHYLEEGLSEDLRGGP